MIRLLGTFEIEFRILVACRERYVTLLRRGWLEGKNVFQTTASIIDMILIPGDKFIVVAGSDKMMNCYTKRVINLLSTISLILKKKVKNIFKNAKR